MIGKVHRRIDHYDQLHYADLEHGQQRTSFDYVHVIWNSTEFKKQESSM